jgi:NAD(P)H-dependent FMN reductase
MTKIGIILGSTRPGRNGEAVAKWVLDVASKRTDAEFELVDLLDYNLPHLDEAIPPSMGQYSKPHTLEWAKKIGSLDGFIFVTPEYNHAPSAALINALSFVYREWNDKAAALVSYGATANGARAADMLRPILGELQIADVRQQLALSLIHDFEGFRTFTPGEQHLTHLQALVSQLESWTAAMQGVREAKLVASAAA